MLDISTPICPPGNKNIEGQIRKKAGLQDKKKYPTAVPDSLWIQALKTTKKSAPACYGRNTRQAPKNHQRHQRPHDQRRNRVSAAGLTYDVDAAAHHPYESAPAAAEARSSPVQHPDHGASFEFSLSWLPPLRVMLVGACSVALSYIDSSPKSYVLLERNHNELLPNPSKC
jgi:hypothetical protein